LILLAPGVVAEPAGVTMSFRSVVLNEGLTVEISGRTNLPDGSILGVQIERRPGPMTMSREGLGMEAARRNVAVADGRFRDTVRLAEPGLPGIYDLRLTLNPKTQPGDLKAFLGELPHQSWSRVIRISPLARRAEVFSAEVKELNRVLARLDSLLTRFSELPTTRSPRSERTRRVLAAEAIELHRMVRGRPNRSLAPLTWREAAELAEEIRYLDPSRRWNPVPGGRPGQGGQGDGGESTAATPRQGADPLSSEGRPVTLAEMRDKRRRIDRMISAEWISEVMLELQFLVEAAPRARTELKPESWESWKTDAESLLVQVRRIVPDGLEEESRIQTRLLLGWEKGSVASDLAPTMEQYLGVVDRSPRDPVTQAKHRKRLDEFLAEWCHDVSRWAGE
jgi:hypothetical protein